MQTSPERRSVLARLLGGLGLVGMCSPLIWLVALGVMWLVARSALHGGLVSWAFGTTLLAMLLGAVLAVWADRLDRRRSGADDDAAVTPPA